MGSLWFSFESENKEHYAKGVKFCCYIRYKKYTQELKEQQKFLIFYKYNVNIK